MVQPYCTTSISAQGKRRGISQTPNLPLSPQQPIPSSFYFYQSPPSQG
jgi:hypothetical protein